MATVQAPTEQRFRLWGVGWKDYLAILDVVGDRRIRVTNDRGDLELMTTSPLHEFSKKHLSRLIEMLSYELDRDIRSGGAFTFNREDLDRGLEPNECYWFRHEPLMRTKMEFDPTIDPPPDLVVEVEVSRSALNRMGSSLPWACPRSGGSTRRRSTSINSSPTGAMSPAPRA